MAKTKNVQIPIESCYNNAMAMFINPSSSTFEFFRNGETLYVDKTKWLYKLIRTNGRIFLSRPRRFGKSLTLSTLEAIFQGRRELFDGLYISQTNYDWKKYPVLRISFGSCGADNGEELERYINFILGYEEEKNNVPHGQEGNSSERFSKLISELAKKEKVVILIDEYEKAITDNIYNPNIEELRVVLSRFYQVLKDQDTNIRFVFITGVTKYTKLSIFSKMNNLRDISLDTEYADMLGYTQEELEYYFAEHIDEAIAEYGFDRKIYLNRLKTMYDGYRFSIDSESVYNPVSIGSFFLQGGKIFRNYWFDTGGSTLLYDLSNNIDFNMATDLSEPLPELALSSFDIADIAKNNINSDFLKTLLLQTGYLTIKEYTEYEMGYYLDFPNREVRTAFNTRYLSQICPNPLDRVIYPRGAVGIMVAVENGDTDRLIKSIKSMLAGIPAEVSSKGLNANEYYYEGLIYMILYAGGVSNVRLEESTNNGRIDAIAESNEHIYIMEFKKDKSAKDAMEQIKSKGYADKYLASGKNLHLLGINFSTKERNIDDVIIEDLQS